MVTKAVVGGLASPMCLWEGLICHVILGPIQNLCVCSHYVKFNKNYEIRKENLLFIFHCFIFRVQQMCLIRWLRHLKYGNSFRQIPSQDSIKSRLEML